MADPNVSDLLARGGWTLDDPRPVAAENPETFELPGAADLAALGPGNRVRAMFRLVTIADVSRDGLSPYDDDGRPVLVTQVERMWAVITDVTESSVHCVLENQPMATHTRLQVFDRLEIPLTHLIATGDVAAGFDEFLAQWESDPDHRVNDPYAPVDPQAPPRIRSDQQDVCTRFSVRAEPPNVFGGALLARNVTPESTVVHGARFDPRAEHRDTGWVFFADSSDFEEVSRTVGFDVVMLQQVHKAHPAAWPYVVLPAGWGFTLGDGYEDVYEIEVSD